MNADERRAWAPVIRVARQAAGLTIEELAALASTTRQTIGAIENGRSTPQEDVLVRILDVLGLRATTDEPDVEAFLGSIRPLLQQLDQPQRQTVMAAVVKIIGEQLPLATDEHLGLGDWVNHWARRRNDGPWTVETEWKPADGPYRADVVIFDRAGKPVEVVELKRGPGSNVEASQTAHQVRSYLHTQGLDDVSVSVLFLPSGFPETSAADELRQSFGRFFGYQQRSDEEVEEIVTEARRRNARRAPRTASEMQQLQGQAARAED